MTRTNGQGGFVTGWRRICTRGSALRRGGQRLPFGAGISPPLAHPGQINVAAGRAAIPDPSSPGRPAARPPRSRKEETRMTESVTIDAAEPVVQVSSIHSTSFPALLRQLDISLLVSTYQA